MSSTIPVGSAMSQLSAQFCSHPELRPTGWNQPRPEPAEMIGCACGMNRHCPVCGWGYGSLVCDCNRALIAEQSRGIYG